MKTQPIEPARIEFAAAPGDPPRSALYGDLYHPRIGALAQAAHVFLNGNGLPARWAGRARFTILETGFGLGNNFLATWDAWRRDAQRCERLSFVSIERHPPRHGDLARAHASSPLRPLADTLLRAWPPLTPNVHMLDFEGGRLQLLLAFGDVAALLPALRLQADAFYLDGFAPACNPAMWQPRVLRALGRKAAPGATLATWSVARELREGLVAAGFDVERASGIGGKREISVARFAPRFAPRAAMPGLSDAAASAREVVVVGAGIAGAATARALARLGLAVTVFERRATPAAEASGNPGGLFHGSVNADDGPHARLYRAAALQAQREYADAIAAGIPGSAAGLVRLDTNAGGWPAMAAMLQRLALPADYVQALDADTASVRVGIALERPAWLYPGGGWLAPAAWVDTALATPGVRLAAGVDVAGLAQGPHGWTLHDAGGRVVARAAIVVLANAAGAARLLAPLGHAPWPLWHTRGQVTHWPDTGASLALPVAGDGYVLPLPGGGLLCGATRDVTEPAGTAADREVRLADHRRNVERLRRLTGLVAPADSDRWQGRVGWRLQAHDRLPVCGALPLPALPPGQRRDQARLLPRQEGLFVITALGSRGLTLAPLLGRLVAAQAVGTPWPLEQDLADAIDPARWLVRAAREGQAGTASGNQPPPG